MKKAGLMWLRYDLPRAEHQLPRGWPQPNEEVETMQFYRKAESAATRILEAFQSGNLPKALAPVFVNRKDSRRAS